MNHKLQIRSMTPRDLHEVMNIEGISFSVPWSLHVFQGEILRNPLAYYVVGVEEGTLVAYLGSWIFITDSHITTLAVHPIYRRKGLATDLMKHFFGEAQRRRVKRISLEVRGSNVKALRFYRLIGFAQVGIRAKYYHDNQEDALVLSLELS